MRRERTLRRYAVGLAGLALLSLEPCTVRVRGLLDQIPPSVYCEIVKDLNSEPIICDYNPEGWDRN